MEQLSGFRFSPLIVNATFLPLPTVYFSFMLLGEFSFPALHQAAMSPPRRVPQGLHKEWDFLDCPALTTSLLHLFSLSLPVFFSPHKLTASWSSYACRLLRRKFVFFCNPLFFFRSDLFFASLFPTALFCYSDWVGHSPPLKIFPMPSLRICFPLFSSRPLSISYYSLCPSTRETLISIFYHGFRRILFPFLFLVEPFLFPCTYTFLSHLSISSSPVVRYFISFAYGLFFFETVFTPVHPFPFLENSPSLSGNCELKLNWSSHAVHSVLNRMIPLFPVPSLADFFLFLWTPGNARSPG